MTAAHFVITKSFLCVFCPSLSVGLVSSGSGYWTQSAPASPGFLSPLVVGLLFHLLYAAHTHIKARPVARLRNVSDVIIFLKPIMGIAHLLTCRKSHSHQVVFFGVGPTFPLLNTTYTFNIQHGCALLFRRLIISAPNWHITGVSPSAETATRRCSALRNALFYHGVILRARV